MKKLFCLMIFALVLLCGIHLFAVETGVLYQQSTLGALQEGVFDGTVSLKDLKSHGNFGLGTFDGLNGELILLDGVCYQIKSDGKVYLPEDTGTSPFASAINFKTDKKIVISKPCSYQELQLTIESNLPSRNIIYAIRISGNFKTVKTRSVPKQNKPYPRLAEVVKTQPVFDMTNQQGTIIGFWIPEYLKGVNMFGYHNHFINNDRTKGGHLLDCEIVNGTLELSYIYKFELTLPEQSDFYRTDLSGDKQKELEKIEK